jgi:hypothetical protein
MVIEHTKRTRETLTRDEKIFASSFFLASATGNGTPNSPKSCLVMLSSASPVLGGISCFVKLLFLVEYFNFFFLREHRVYYSKHRGDLV